MLATSLELRKRVLVPVSILQSSSSMYILKLVAAKTWTSFSSIRIGTKLSDLESLSVSLRQRLYTLSGTRATRAFAE